MRDRWKNEEEGEIPRGLTDCVHLWDMLPLEEEMFTLEGNILKRILNKSKTRKSHGSGVSMAWWVSIHSGSIAVASVYVLIHLGDD